MFEAYRSLQYYHLIHIHQRCNNKNTQTLLFLVRRTIRFCLSAGQRNLNNNKYSLTRFPGLFQFYLLLFYSIQLPLFFNMLHNSHINFYFFQSFTTARYFNISNCLFFHVLQPNLVKFMLF